MSTYILSIIAEGKDNASGPLRSLAGAFSNIGMVAGGILTAGLFIGIGNQIKAFATEAINATANVEKMGMMLQTLQARELIRSGDFTDMNKALAAAAPLAKKTMDQLERISIISPYQLENVQNTFRMAMAFGFTSDQATLFTKAILNLGAGVGAGSEQLDRMAYNLAQVKMQGRVTAVDIRQLAMAGLDLTDVLKFVGKQMGVNIKDHNDFNKAIANGTITWEDFTTNFAKYADINFGGAAERMSRTLDGLKSTFKDLFQLSLPKIMGPSTELVVSLLNDILTAFIGIRNGGALEILGQELKEKIKPGIDAMRNFLEEVGLLGQGIDDMRGRSFEKLDFGTELKRKFEEIDWAAIGEFVWEEIKKFGNELKERISQIDWVAIGDAIQEGIENIKWSEIGMSLHGKAYELYSNIAKGVTQAMDDADLATIVGSALIGMSEAVASSLTGQQITLENSLAGYVAFGDGVKNAIKEWQLKTETAIVEWYLSNNAKMQEWKANVSQSIFDAISGIVPMIAEAIRLWNTPVDQELTRIKNTFVTSVTSWVQGSIKTLLTMGPLLIQALTDLMTKLRNSIKPVSFSINLPNFDHLVEQALEGAQRVQDALKGQGIKGGKSTNPNGNGGSSSNNGNGDVVQSFSGGGIATGPMSGYFANLHGTEAVIPMKNGSIPVALNAPRSDGGGSVNTTNNITINVNGSDNPETVAREIFRILKVQGVTA